LLGGVLAASAIGVGGVAAAWAESLTVSSTGERAVGKSQTIIANGVADGAHRLFLYYDPQRSGCQPRPGENLGYPGEVSITPPEGLPVTAGPFTREYTGPLATTETYGVCAYLASGPFEFYDAVALSCVFPGGNCYMVYVEPWVIQSAERAAREAVERAIRERGELEAKEQAERRSREEARVAREAREQAEHALPATVSCHVPALRGHTLTGAKRMLRRAHCSLGTVTKPHNAHGRLVVKSQSQRAGRTLSEGGRVSLRLGP
jgi:hypothetical protein